MRSHLIIGSGEEIARYKPPEIGTDLNIFGVIIGECGINFITNFLFIHVEAGAD